MQSTLGVGRFLVFKRSAGAGATVAMSATQLHVLWAQISVAAASAETAVWSESSTVAVAIEGTQVAAGKTFTLNPGVLFDLSKLYFKGKAGGAVELEICCVRPAA